MSYNQITLQNSITKLIKTSNRIENKTKTLGLVRLFVFFSGLVVLGYSFFNFDNHTTTLILVIEVILFIIISVWQSNYIKYLKILNKWIDIKKSFLSRSTLDWKNIKRRIILNDENLTYLETDFNLSGDRSLIHLIDFSSSEEGTETLKDLLVNHDLRKSKIDERQNIVKELITFNKFRERFLLVISQLRGKSENSNNIKKWLKSKTEINKIKFLLQLLIPISLINLIFIILHLTNIITSVWMISSFIYVAIYYLTNKYYNNIGKVCELIEEDLGKVSKVFEFIDNSNFSNYKSLKNLCKPIQSNETSPTLLFKQVNRVIELLSLRSNPFVWFFLIVLFPVDFFIAYKLEKYKSKMVENYDKWQNVWHQLEAFVSIASFAKLNSEYQFPQINEDSFELEVENVGHPLIRKSEKIENNFRLNSIGNIFLITGSNMSGKSTFLRTLGINICLAYAGAPVNSTKFNISLFRLFSCIKVSDSVVDGISYFYSEVKRLKQLLDEFEKPNNTPIIFFIDEIFKGTNNIERRIGSSAFIKSLVGNNGFGFITTHDLELVNLAEDQEKILNYHFKENVINKKMEFDYKLYNGPCPTTNALKIMKIEGLPID